MGAFGAYCSGGGRGGHGHRNQREVTKRGTREIKLPSREWRHGHRVKVKRLILETVKGDTVCTGATETTLDQTDSRRQSTPEIPELLSVFFVFFPLFVLTFSGEGSIGHIYFSQLDLAERLLYFQSRATVFSSAKQETRSWISPAEDRDPRPCPGSAMF